jgi:hypothetical protein
MAQAITRAWEERKPVRMGLLEDFREDMGEIFADMDLTKEAVYRPAGGSAAVATYAGLVVSDGDSTEWGGGTAISAQAHVLKSAVGQPAAHDLLEIDGDTWQVTGIIADGGATWTIGVVRDLKPGVG